jgi:hypothetical protein
MQRSGIREESRAFSTPRIPKLCGSIRATRLRSIIVSDYCAR